MKISSKTYLIIFVSLLVLLLIVGGIAQLFKSTLPVANPTAPIVAVTSTPAETTPAPVPTPLKPTPVTSKLASPAVANIGTLHAQASANITCADTTGSRCQTGTNYADFGIKIYQGSTLVQGIKLNTDGSLNIKLPPGSYMVYPDYYTPGIVTTNTWTANLPQNVMIRVGITSSITFAINYTQR